MNIGSIVKVLLPFDTAYPDSYTVVGITGTIATLDNGVDFDSTYLVEIGQATGIQTIPKAPITRFEFLSRLTAAQRIGIRTAAQTNPVLQDAMSMLDCAQEIRTDNQFTIDMISYCVTLGLISETDKQNILA